MLSADRPVYWCYVAQARDDFFCPEGRSVYAVIASGGKQYRVEEGGLITVERLAGEAGAAVTLADVLLVADGEKVKAGTPKLSGASVKAEIVAQGKGEKILVFHYKNKTRARKLRGHRQQLTTLRITKIEV